MQGTYVGFLSVFLFFGWGGGGGGYLLRVCLWRLSRRSNFP